MKNPLPRRGWLFFLLFLVLFQYAQIYYEDRLQASLIWSETIKIPVKIGGVTLSITCNNIGAYEDYKGDRNLAMITANMGYSFITVPTTNTSLRTRLIRGEKYIQAAECMYPGIFQQARFGIDAKQTFTAKFSRTFKRLFYFFLNYSFHGTSSKNRIITLTHNIINQHIIHYQINTSFSQPLS